jgi:hypothetical protein
VHRLEDTVEVCGADIALQGRDVRLMVFVQGEARWRGDVLEESLSSLIWLV